MSASAELQKRLERALALYNRGHTEEAFGEFLWCATRGDPDGAYMLGWVYAHGTGTARDMSKAIYWYDRAGRVVASAAYNLALLYRSGATGGGVDARLARRWFRRAALLGLPDAWARYGELYLEGGLLGRDDKKALQLFCRGAEDGSADAAYRLGIAYVCGWGVEPNERQAARWLRIAAERGHTRAAGRLGVLLAKQVECPPAESLRWLMMAARRGDAVAQFNVGVMYLNGVGVERNEKVARYWFTRGAKNNDSSAQYNLAIMLFDGEGGPSDVTSALFWLRIAQVNGRGGLTALVEDWQGVAGPLETARVEDWVAAWPRRKQRHT